jgi:hypothetical protein
MNPVMVQDWGVDWAWGLPLIVLIVVLHAFCLGLLNKEVSVKLRDERRLLRFPSVSISVIGGTALSATILHGFEGLIWAGAYRFLGALPDTKTAILYSLSAITTYGHAGLYLAPRWQLIGALEALNGTILFGLTTAFLFTVLQKTWSHT